MLFKEIISNILKSDFYFFSGVMNLDIKNKKIYIDGFMTKHRKRQKYNFTGDVFLYFAFVVILLILSNLERSIDFNKELFKKILNKKKSIFRDTMFSQQFFKSFSIHSGRLRCIYDLLY